MENKTRYLGTAIYIGVFLMFGCSSSGAIGCGSSGTGGEGQVESSLPGIYQVTEYRFTEDGCDESMATVGSVSRVVIYRPDETDTAVLVAGFCGDVASCRTRAAVKPATVNYGFFQGSDAEGWTGWGIAGEGSVGEMCRLEVQVHELTSSGNGGIRIDTRQVEAVFTGEIVDGQATCTVRDAVASVREDSPCHAVFIVEATFETGL